MKIETVRIDSLKPDPVNPRTHDDRNFQAVRSSLERFKQQVPIVVDRQGVVRKGNCTLRAAQSLGWNHIDVVVSELDADEAAAYGVADNRTAELAGWDPDVLLSLNVDLGKLSFSEADQAELRELSIAGADGGGDSNSGDSRATLGKSAPTIRVVLALSALKEFESAILATGKINRSDAILELCRSYVKADRQLNVQAEGDASPPGPVVDEPPARRDRNPRRKRKAV